MIWLMPNRSWNMDRKKYFYGAVWESKVAYSRAIQVGQTIEVAGTVAANGDTVFHPDNPYEQTKFILNKINDALNYFGASKEDVVRTRMFVVNIDQWEEIGRAHGEFFSGINPVTTMVEVSRLINEGLLVEIEATAIVANKST